MKIPLLASNFLDSMAECASLDSALVFTEAKATDVQNQLAAVGFIVPKPTYMMWYKMAEFVNNELEDDCQFMLDLDTIANALKGNWSPMYMQPDYYIQLKEIVFSIRGNFIKKSQKEESISKISLMYHEIKAALAKREKPLIKCVYNVWKEKFIIMFDDKTPEGISGVERAKFINAQLKSWRDGIGKDTWMLSYGFDVQNSRDLVRDDEFQHAELQKMVASLKMPF